MASIGHFGRGLIALSGVALLGVLWFAWGASYQLPHVATTTTKPPISEVPLAESHATPASGSFAKRPLFSPTRRPPVVTEPSSVDGPADSTAADLEAQAQDEAKALIEAEKAAQTLNGYRLVGTILRQGHKLAIIEHEDQEDAASLEEGDELEGWLVINVLSNGITLTRNGEERVFLLQTTDPSPEVVQEKSDRPGPAGPARLYRPPSH